ncbi:glycosyltransferase family 2 protein [Flavobacterium cupreum]|uniref:Glycosyltransferase family 2 protein n=1 Tax=Flavobacterium cupreum TaxID=2133766 RepID=A0A434A7J2_9FLAO|nr:glycosyltransferase family A protein [Flavobacterium cupreum]RUT70389.1 glycosyltransferase family 2 protein [Flavobacterium cupreum]
MLAIIIPYYKLTFFEAALESLANQTDKRFRVYIGDDASTEDCSVLLARYKKKIDFVYHRFEDNLGSISLTRQWERCIALSTAEKWLMLLGDDDVLGSNVVEEFYGFLDSKKEKVDLIRFNLSIIDKEGQLQGSNFEHEVHEKAEQLLDQMLLMKETITASEFIFSRAIYSANKGFVDFPLAWFSDYATWLVFSKNNGIHYIKSASVYWRLSGINISSEPSNLKNIRLKVKSLFLFLYFVQVNFKVENKRLKQYAHSQLINIFGNISDFTKIKFLCKECFKFKFRLTEIITIEFLYRRIKRKKMKNLWKYLFPI